MPAIAFDATNPFLKNRYASLGAVIEASRPILAAHGLSVCQLPCSEGEMIGLESVLLHSSGEWLSDRILLPLGEEKGKSRAQVAGSVITYLRRYSWASILGLYADEDNDGNAVETPTIRPKVQTIQPVVVHKPQVPQPTSETPEKKRDRFVAMCIDAGNGNPQVAESLFIEMGILMENEPLSEFPIDKVPATKSVADGLLASIRQRVPAPEPVEEMPDSRLRVSGLLTKVTEKTGTKKNGQPWHLFGLNVDSKWFNTFDTIIGAQAKAHEGEPVEVCYEEGEKGNNAIAIIIDGKEYPETPDTSH